jgi:hypothetical protein
MWGWDGVCVGQCCRTTGRRMPACLLLLFLTAPLSSWGLAPCPGETRGDRYKNTVDGLVHIGSFVLTCAIQTCPASGPGWHPVQGRPGVTGTNIMVLCMLVLLYLHMLFKPVLGSGNLSRGDQGWQVHLSWSCVRPTWRRICICNVHTIGKYGVRSPKFIWPPCAQLYSLAGRVRIQHFIKALIRIEIRTFCKGLIQIWILITKNQSGFSKRYVISTM